MTATSALEAGLLATFDRLSIAWMLHEHPAVFTVAESEAIHALLPGIHTKNLFLKDAGQQFWLVSAPHDARVDLKALAAVIGSRKLSFGKAEDMARLLGVTPGSVTPLAAIQDIACEVTVVLDRRLVEAGRVNVHPLRNTATLGLSGPDLALFLAETRHRPLIVDLPEAPAPLPTEAIAQR